MKKHKNNRKYSRVERIERKCDRILRELSIIRRHLDTCKRPIDDAIELMHHNARRMRVQAEKDAQLLRKMFQTK